jgi:hypothetical protein
MTQKSNIKTSKSAAAPSTGIGAPTKSYGTGKARSNLKPTYPVKGK